MKPALFIFWLGLLFLTGSPLLGDEFPIRRVAGPGDALLGNVVNPSGENITGGGEVVFLNFDVFRWQDEQLGFLLERGQETNIPKSPDGSDFLRIGTQFSVPRVDLVGRGRLFSRLGSTFDGSALWTILSNGELSLVARSADDLPDMADTIWTVEWETAPLIVSSGDQDMLLFELIRQRSTGGQDRVYARANSSGGLETPPRRLPAREGRLLDCTIWR